MNNSNDEIMMRLLCGFSDFGVNCLILNNERLLLSADETILYLPIIRSDSAFNVKKKISR